MNSEAPNRTPSGRASRRGLACLLALLLCAAISSGAAVRTGLAQELMLVKKTLGSAFEAPLAGVYVHENLGFVGGMSTGYHTAANIGIRIVDLSMPNEPELVGRIPLRAKGYFEDHSHGDAVAARLATNAFEGTVAIVLDGVPDTFQPEQYPEPIGIWDVSDPARPNFLSAINFGMSPHGAEGGDLGDKPRDARAVHGHHVFALYEKGPRPGRDFHLGVADISDPSNPVIVGDWQHDRRTALMGLSLNEDGTRAYITGVWSASGLWGRNATHRYLYVLDIEDPTAPTELGRFVYEQTGVISSMWVARPAKGDSVVIMTDGTWESGHGILHFFDVSDPTEIMKISEFDTVEDFGMATDIAVRGNLVYSTWLDGAVVSIDISDPRQPKALSHYPTTTNLSDVALLGDGHVVASSVWAAGLYVLEDESIAADAEQEAGFPPNFLLNQNYPNPFNPTTEISFDLPEASEVQLVVFDMMGREVTRLATGLMPAGRHQVTWKADGLPGGVYLYRLTANSFNELRSMVLLR